MRITGDSIGKARRRYAHDARVLIMLVRLPCQPLTTITADNVKGSGRDLAKAEGRVAHISSVTSNFHALSEEQCPTNLRFPMARISQIVKIFNWDGPTSRCGYTCDHVTAVCVFPLRLAYTTRWIDLHSAFGMRASKMSDIFWAVAHTLLNYKAKRVAGFRGDILQVRCSLYASSIVETGGYLYSCVSFIDGTKISLCRPRCLCTNQCASYSGHKRHHCLGYQTVPAPYGLILYILGPTEGREPDCVIYSRTGINDFLWDNLVIKD